MSEPDAKKIKTYPQVRKWCFTNFDLMEDGSYDYDPSGFSVLKYGIETCPSTGKTHHQGFAVTKRKVRMQGFQKLIGSKVHCQPMGGTLADSIKYCSKESELTVVCDDGYNDEGGRPSTIDWSEVRQMAIDGKFEQINDHAYVTQYKNIHAIHNESRVACDLDHPCGIWIWGAPGLGKTTLARDLAGADYYEKDFNKWWCGYSHQNGVILDDADQTNTACLVGQLKVWSDQYAFRPETKGSNLGKIRPPVLIVTSQYHFNDLFNREDAIALARRFTTYHLFLSNNVIKQVITPRLPSLATLYVREEPTLVGQESAVTAGMVLEENLT